MITFSVTASTISAKELGEFAKTNYGLKNNFNCKLFRTEMNHTYFLSNNEKKYVLRANSHNWRAMAEIIEKIELLKLLSENNLSVSYPIKDKKGDFMQEI